MIGLTEIILAKRENNILLSCAIPPEIVNTNGVKLPWSTFNILSL